MPAPALLTQVNVSAGGMPKLPVLFARVSTAGVAGDRQKILDIHGGPNRAICVYSEELYAELRAEGVSAGPGDFGENFTTRGLDLSSLAPGDRLRVGECLIEITKVRVPCTQLKMWHADLHRMIIGRSGWMARVIEEGVVKAGDAICVVQPPLRNDGI